MHQNTAITTNSIKKAKLQFTMKLVPGIRYPEPVRDTQAGYEIPKSKYPGRVHRTRDTQQYNINISIHLVENASMSMIQVRSSIIYINSYKNSVTSTFLNAYVFGDWWSVAGGLPVMKVA